MPPQFRDGTGRGRIIQNCSGIAGSRADSVGMRRKRFLFNPDTVEAYAKRAEISPKPLFAAPPVPVVSEGLVKAVRFYEQVKRENPPVETGVWKDAVDWVLKEACCAVILGKADNPLASSNQVGELTMWVKRLVSQLKKANPDSKLPEKAMDYLKRNGLISVEDVLR